MSIYKDYAELRKSIGAVQKSGKNPHFKNTFVELNKAIEVVDEHIENNNFICFVQVPKTIDGKNYLNTKLIHNSGEVIEGDLELIITKHDPQMLGSSLSYARRYSLITILGLQAVDDDGNDASDKGKIAEERKKREAAEKAKKELAIKLAACKNVEEIDAVISTVDAKDKTNKLIDYVNNLKSKIGE